MKFNIMPAKEAFLGLKNTDCNYEQAEIVVIPFGLEKTVSYGNGTANAPEAIIKASHEVELFDEELQYQTSDRMKIITLEDTRSIQHLYKNTIKSQQAKSLISNYNNNPLDYLSAIIKQTIHDNKLSLTFGGEHTISAAIIKPLIQKHQEITILHFDAHADLRNAYNGDKFSHASAMRRCLDYDNVNLLSFGIRNISQEGMDFYKNNQHRIKIFWAYDKGNWNYELIKQYLTNKNIYLSFDVDSFDSSLMPATGTPEPGGLFWDDVIKIIRLATQFSKIIAIDINELAPIATLHSCDFCVAKLAYKILSLIQHYKKL